MKWDHGLRLEFVRRAQSSRARLLVLFIAATLIGATPSLTVAQSTLRAPHGPGSRLAVDVVKLKSGKTMRGTIARADAHGLLTMAVSREWLRKADPKMLASVEAEEAGTRVAALEQLRDRIKKELEQVPEESPVAAFLRVERKQVDLLAESPQPEKPQFVWLELTAKKVAKIASPSGDQKRIAGWSWYERLASVETRDADDLARELARKRIDRAQPVPDLSERLPLRLQDEREWSARMALIHYSLGKPLDFQETGDLLVRADRAKNAGDIAPLVAKLFGGQVDALLKDLLNEGRSATDSSAPGSPKSSNAWLEPAIREAEREKARAFRATRVDLSLERRQATVHSAFAVQLANGKWEVIWSDRDTEDGSQERPAIEAGIANDPQVKSALGLLKSLGANGDDQVRTAIRFGAATMAAQQAVNSRFSKFQEAFLRRLDGPPLWWAN
ncbi:MAG TPA: hypothetical protein VGP76_32305 [Planctomycetaceae bacterium]|jgi:hypothetical protein|nr:hypothetical protein [Planctomycetaceae bacterium]